MKALHRSCSRCITVSGLSGLPTLGSFAGSFHSSAPRLKKKKKSPPAFPGSRASPSNENGVTATPTSLINERLRTLMLQEGAPDYDRDVLSASDHALARSYSRSEDILDMLSSGKARIPSQSTKSKKGIPQKLSKNQKRRLKKQLLSEQLRKDFQSKEAGSSKVANKGEVMEANENGIMKDSGLGGTSLARIETTGMTFDGSGKDRAPHLPRTLLYTRRVEGLVAPLRKPVLEGEIICFFFF